MKYHPTRGETELIVNCFTHKTEVRNIILALIPLYEKIS